MGNQTRHDGMQGLWGRLAGGHQSGTETHKARQRTGELAPVVTCLPHKLEGLSSGPGTHGKKQRQPRAPVKPSAGEAETGGFNPS